MFVFFSPVRIVFRVFYVPCIVHMYVYLAEPEPECISVPAAAACVCSLTSLSVVTKYFMIQCTYCEPHIVWADCESRCARFLHAAFCVFAKELFGSALWHFVCLCFALNVFKQIYISMQPEFHSECGERIQQ